MGLIGSLTELQKIIPHYLKGIAYDGSIKLPTNNGDELPYDNLPSDIRKVITQEGVIQPRTKYIEDNYTLSKTDQVLLADPTVNSGFTVTLTTEEVEKDGREVTIKDISGSIATNNITLASEDTATIDGNSTQLLDVNYTSITIKAYNNNWYIIAFYT